MEPETREKEEVKNAIKETKEKEHEHEQEKEEEKKTERHGSLYIAKQFVD